jgi:hypothetical protein
VVCLGLLFRDGGPYCHVYDADTIATDLSLPALISIFMK